MHTELDIIADDGNLCGEGPLWDERERSLYWTDITGRRFYRYRREQGRHELLSDGFEVGGFCCSTTAALSSQQQRHLDLASRRARHAAGDRSGRQECA